VRANGALCFGESQNGISVMGAQGPQDIAVLQPPTDGTPDRALSHVENLLSRHRCPREKTCAIV
jgi:hypothetical protein